MTHVLEQIIIVLPAGNSLFEEKIISFFARCSAVQDKKVHFSPSNTEFLPKVSLEFQKVSEPKVLFLNGNTIEVPIKNTTGRVKKSPHKYKPLSIEEIVFRLEGIKIVEIDHVGFNLPWFDGTHPDIVRIRELYKRESMYYLFPTGEDWDFIIPGTVGEISGKSSIDYTIKRRPKFEIVSFNKCSKPLIQIDVLVHEKFEKLTSLFPEAIQDLELKNMWVYLKTPYNIDICLVLNDYRSGDWCEFFKESRLL